MIFYLKSSLSKCSVQYISLIFLLSSKDSLKRRKTFKGQKTRSKQRERSKHKTERYNAYNYKNQPRLSSALHECNQAGPPSDR